MGEEALPLTQGPLLRVSKWEQQHPWLIAGFTLRKDGDRPFNCALHVGDDHAAVLVNREKLAAELHLSLDDLVCGEQVHGDQLRYVTTAEKGRGSRKAKDALPGVDGLYTDQPSILLTSFYADCVPLFFVDVRHKVVGLAHAGWRGTAAQIGPKMIARWQREFGSRVEEIKVLIGPAIGGCCYEVGQDVLEKLESLSTLYHPSAVQKKDEGRYMLDLKKINLDLIRAAGVPKEQIDFSHWCTSCHNHLFFSHRKEQGRTGRMASFITIKA